VMEQHSDSDSESWRWSRPPRTTPPVIDRRVLPSGEVEEWERAATIPDDFIYDPVSHSYYAPGEPSSFDAEAFCQSIREITEERRRAPPIPREQLLVPAGTLHVPASRRKSLGCRPEERQRGLFDDQDALADEQPASGADDAESPG
jgi:hypothetical protein